ncbi:MAG: class I SAM-dependent methyltransferase [Kiritimatiellia bacterium]
MSAGAYWDRLAARYQRDTRISTRHFHLGPLLPCATRLGLLPDLPPGARCLEAGCGGGQNSLFLARSGHGCTAIDNSRAMLECGREQARALDLPVDFVHADLDDLPSSRSLRGPFDFIHSAYALPFTRDPSAVIAALARRLRPGGTLLVSTGHPLFAMPRADFTDGGFGVVVEDYFHPPADRRRSGGGSIAARTAPVSTLLGWFLDAGLRIDRVAEPRPLPVHRMSAKKIEAAVPYWSHDWISLRPELEAVPVVLVVRAGRAAAAARAGISGRTAARRTAGKS